MSPLKSLQGNGVKDAAIMASTSKLRRTTSVTSLNDNKKTTDQTDDYQGSEVHLEERDFVTIICDDESESAQHLDKYIYDSETQTLIYADDTDVNAMNNEKGRTQATVHVCVPFNGTGTDNEYIELENDSEGDPNVEDDIKSGSDFSREKHLLGHFAGDKTGELENDGNIFTPLYNVDAKGTDNETQLYENDLGRFMYLTDVSFRKTCFPDIWSRSGKIKSLYNSYWHFYVMVIVLINFVLCFPLVSVYCI